MIGAFYNASDLRILGYFSHNGENLPCKHHTYLIFPDTFYSLAVIVIVTVEPAFSLAGLDPFLFPDMPGQPLGFVLKIFSKRQERKCFSSENIAETELFWNQIMMEHAVFIRGLLDPTECELVETANTFAGDYCRLLEEARQQDCRAMNGLTRKTLETTKKYCDFKAAGTKGITGCDIRSIILPLLADHVLREANHYLRILKQEGE